MMMIQLEATWLQETHHKRVELIMASSIVGEASSSSLATTSSFPPQRPRTYHVFLSFRGQDTRKGFTDHLCAALERKGIKTFRDDKFLETGELISDELVRAIEESLFAITVLSPNYASSVWCLDELRKIVECSKNNQMGLSILPVFHGVDPSDVRHQKGTFGNAFRKHGDRFGENSEKIKQWRDALTHVASCSGWESKDKHEATFVENIAEHIHKQLISKLPSCIENLVGILPKMEDVYSLLGLGSNDVRFIGICGMGGIGKTTVARAVYESIQGEFKFSCFMRDVREASNKNGFVQLQKNLLSGLKIISSCYFDDVEDGKKIIKNSLCNKKVLLVLDDVSEEIQLENLAENQDWFGNGSRIIITTRYKHLLEILRVHGTYMVEGLMEEQALHLFSSKAFKRDKPEEGYLDLSKEVVKYTGGLPLALKVFGSYLCRRDIAFWHRAIREIRSVQRSEIINALKISYDHLEEIEKNIFLDIACFFKGMKRDEVIDILTKCDFYEGIENGIVTLIDKSLVTLNKYEMLEMHDLLQDMGKNIVYQESPNNPGKRSRLCSKKEIDRVLTNDMGTDTIQSIVLHLSYEAQWSVEAFLMTSQLTFLSLHGMKLPLGLNYLPKSLKVLHWNYCPLKTLPLADEKYELVEIKLRNSEIEQLWHGKKFLGKLKYIDLSVSEKLKQTPDLSGVPMLERLDLHLCSSLTEVHPSLVRHKNLVLLDFSYCTSLRTLPGELEMSSLERLNLSHCRNFENLPEFGECKKLSWLSLKRTAISELPESFGCNPHISKLIESLSAFDSHVPFLSSLDLSYCHLTDEAFPQDFFHFPSLKDLNLSRNDFKEVPMSIHKLPKLRRLWLNRCRNLFCLPDLPSSMRELEACACPALSRSYESYYHLPTICSFFNSPGKDRSQFLIMEFSGWEIQEWFVPQDDRCISVPHDCPENERIGFVLCFRSMTDLHIRNGKRLITKKISSERDRLKMHLYILCFTNDYFSDEFGQDYRFELLVNHPDFDLRELESTLSSRNRIHMSAGRWVSEQDIEDVVEAVLGENSEEKDGEAEGDDNSEETQYVEVTLDIGDDSCIVHDIKFGI